MSSILNLLEQDTFKELNLNSFKEQFFKLTNTWTWEIQGFVDRQSVVYPIDSDTKVLSTVFERLASPVIRSIAKDSCYVVEIANQTTYPDFTLTLYSHDRKILHRIAIDVKTTYAERAGKPNQFKNMKFTLGSYKSFIRNDTKNILHSYSTYNEHWVLGFIYLRNSGFQEYDLGNLPKVGEINCPYTIQNIFLVDKIDIIGLRAGSGNTANIGSVALNNPRDFSIVKGPFTRFKRAKEAADYFWCNYERLKSEISDEASLVAHAEFTQFL
ncbi:UNVERIFIED_CONTAM: ecoRVR [Trichonephila clavipes]